MSPHWRKHTIVCQRCETESTRRVVTEDLPGGIRINCQECGEVAVHTSRTLHPDEPKITTDESGEWSGKVKSRYL